MMGQCGCGDYQGFARFPGPEGTTYVLDLRMSCDQCQTPAGVVIYRMTPDDVAKWRADELPVYRFGTYGHGEEDTGANAAESCIAVLDPEILRDKLRERAAGMLDTLRAAGPSEIALELVEEIMDEAITVCFVAAVVATYERWVLPWTADAEAPSDGQS